MSNRTTCTALISHLFLVLFKAPGTLRHSPKCTGHSTQVLTSTSLLPLRKREAPVVEPVAGVSEVGKRLRPRWTLPFFFVGDRLSNTKTSD